MTAFSPKEDTINAEGTIKSFRVGQPWESGKPAVLKLATRRTHRKVITLFWFPDITKQSMFSASDRDGSVSKIIPMSFLGQAFAREVKDGVAVSVSLEETVVADNVTQL